jgi:CDP-glycerol glycerophosphotransferase (TagB/SpsB family)
MTSKRRSSDIIHTDLLAVWGPVETEVFEGLHPANSGKTVVTGNPAYDRIAGAGRTSQDRRSELGIPPEHCGKQLLLFVGNYVGDYSAFETPDLVEWGLELLAAYVARMCESKHVLFRPHPARSDKKWLAHFAESPRVSVVKGHAFLELLQASDVVVTYPFSTAGLDAMVCDKPFVLIRRHPNPHEIPYLGYGTCESATTVEELQGAIDRAMDPAGNRCFRARYGRFIRDFAGSVNGQSKSRLLRLVDRMTSVPPASGTGCQPDVAGMRIFAGKTKEDAPSMEEPGHFASRQARA